MKLPRPRTTLLLVVLAVGLAGAAAWMWRPQWLPAVIGRAAQGPSPAAATAGKPGQRPPIPVEVAKAQRKTVQIDVEAVGTVQPIASIALKARLDSQVTAVHVEEGAKVKQGDLLFSLDDRILRDQRNQLAAQVQKDEAQLQQAQRDVVRADELVTKGAGPRVTLENAQTAAKAQEAQLAFDRAALAHIETQIAYTEIRSPVSGRIGSIAAKVGTVVRGADTQSLATINQIDPIYVAFAVPQQYLDELRAAMARQPVRVEAGSGEMASGEISFLENNIDPATGTLTVKARMSNPGEILWPGAFVPARAILGTLQDAVTVPTAAVQMGQKGAYVYVVKDGRAKLVTVKVTRTLNDETVIGSGLQGDEQVVITGQGRVADGAAVNVVQPAVEPAAEDPDKPTAAAKEDGR